MKIKAKKTVGMISLGCAKNRVDAEMLLHTLKNAGYEYVPEYSGADCVLVNTCGFIESAKQESIDETLELVRLKEEGKIKAIILTGCLAERYKDEIKKELPEVDSIVTLGNNGKIAEAVEAALLGRKFDELPKNSLLELNGDRVQSTPKHYAYLRVSDGCDNCCTYCAIPLIRGGFRSRQMEAILKEAETLAKNGVRELLVIAQDTTRYGEDIYGKPALPRLLRELCKIEEIRWVRLLYCYPERVTEELLETMADEGKILHYIDLPLQHCNGRILREMNRRGDRESITKLIEKIRGYLPNVVIRTTFITGFPGETQEEFEELCEFIKEAKFERLGCFAYSREEDTPAALLPNQIDEDEKKKRAEIIMDLQQNIMDSFHSSLIGRKLEVVAEGYDEYIKHYFGRGYTDAPEVDSLVFFSSDKPLEIGAFAEVEIIEVVDGEIYGRRI